MFCQTLVVRCSVPSPHPALQTVNPGLGRWAPLRRAFGEHRACGDHRARVGLGLSAACPGQVFQPPTIPHPLLVALMGRVSRGDLLKRLGAMTTIEARQQRGCRKHARPLIFASPPRILVLHFPLA